MARTFTPLNIDIGTRTLYVAEIWRDDVSVVQVEATFTAKQCVLSRSSRLLDHRTRFAVHRDGEPVADSWFTDMVAVSPAEAVGKLVVSIEKRRAKALDDAARFAEQIAVAEAAEATLTPIPLES